MILSELEVIHSHAIFDYFHLVILSVDLIEIEDRLGDQLFSLTYFIGVMSITFIYR